MHNASFAYHRKSYGIIRSHKQTLSAQVGAQRAHKAKTMRTHKAPSAHKPAHKGCTIEGPFKMHLSLEGVPEYTCITTMHKHRTLAEACRGDCASASVCMACKPSAQAQHTSRAHKPNTQAQRTSPTHKPSAQACAQSETHKPAHKADLCVHKDFFFHNI